MFSMNYIAAEKAEETWPWIADMVRSVLRYTMGEQTEELLYRKVQQKELFLCLLLENNSLCGYTLFRDYADELGARSLVVQHVFIKPGTSDKMLEFVNKEMELIASHTKCKAVKIYTTRKAMGRRLAPMGFKQSYVEFVKQIGG